MRSGAATGSSLGFPSTAPGISENSTMTDLSRYLLILGMAMEYKKAVLVKEQSEPLRVKGSRRA